MPTNYARSNFYRLIEPVLEEEKIVKVILGSVDNWSAPPHLEPLRAVACPCIFYTSQKYCIFNI